MDKPAAEQLRDPNYVHMKILRGEIALTKAQATARCSPVSAPSWRTSNPKALQSLSTFPKQSDKHPKAAMLCSGDTHHSSAPPNPSSGLRYDGSRRRMGPCCAAVARYATAQHGSRDARRCIYGQPDSASGMGE